MLIRRCTLRVHAQDRPAASTPTDDMSFAHVRPAGMLAAILMLTGCSAESRAPAPAVTQNMTEQASGLDNFAVEMEPGWTEVSPDLVFDPRSPARALPRPRELAGADFGYFGDAVMTRQYSPNQLSKMRSFKAGFTMTRDLDGDGVAETYRTGFWRIGDARTGEAREGSFLAVFDPGRPPQVIDSTSTEEDTGVFLSGAGRGLEIAWCNCPGGTVGYVGKRLSVTWADRSTSR